MSLFVEYPGSLYMYLRVDDTCIECLPVCLLLLYLNMLLKFKSQRGKFYVEVNALLQVYSD